MADDVGEDTKNEKTLCDPVSQQDDVKELLDLPFELLENVATSALLPRDLFAFAISGTQLRDAARNAIFEAKRVDAFLKKVCSSLEQIRGATVLEWPWKGVTDDDSAVLAHLIGSGPVAKMAGLFLAYNQIGDEGLKSLSAALGSRAVPKLEQLWLNGNQIGDAGLKSLSAALGSGAVPKLEGLVLAGNQIGDAGLKSLSAALGSGAVPKLKKIYVDTKDKNHQQLKAACSERGVEIVSSCEFVFHS